MQLLSKNTIRIIFAIITIIVLFVIKVSAQIPTNGLVAYYSFNGNANDESSNENNGTTPGGISWVNDRFGNRNSAAGFDGVDDYVLVPNSISLQSPVTAMSAASWIYIDSYPSGQTAVAGIFDKTNTSSYGEYGLSVHAWGEHPGVMIVLGTGGASFPMTIDIQRWHFIAYTWDGETVTLYIDGVNIGSKPFSGSILADSNPLTLGMNSPGATEYLNGKLDDIRIYNRALSISEIVFIYHEGGWNPTTNDLIAYYPFNGNANDESGHMRNGTNNGSTLTTDRFSNLEQAYAFNGTSNYIDIGNLDPIYDISISAWMKCNSTTSTGFLFGTANQDNAILALQYNASNQLEFLASTSTANSKAIQGIHPSLTTDWHHVVVTRKDSTLAIYLDGNKIPYHIALDQGNSSGSILSNTSMAIGASTHLPDPVAGFFDGQLDDIRFYNRVLSETEIRTLYHGGAWPIKPTPENPILLRFKIYDQDGNALPEAKKIYLKYGNNKYLT